MMLSELAFGCYVYGRLSNFDRSYNRFREATGGFLELDDDRHRMALLKWLNAWGCRQFEKDYHDFASEELRSWYQESREFLVSRDVDLWELEPSQLDQTETAYNSLVARTASHKQNHNQEIPVRFGPAGAAKILFALRPKCFIPWDEAIRKGLQLDEDGQSYRHYLEQAKETIFQVQQQCQSLGLSLDDLPRILGRDTSTVSKLIDEYYWVTLTKGCRPPSTEVLQQWAGWSAVL